MAAPARPPGLGGGHCGLGLADAVACESCGGSPVQGYEGQGPGEPAVLVGSQALGPNQRGKGAGEAGASILVMAMARQRTRRRAGRRAWPEYTDEPRRP